MHRQKSLAARALAGTAAALVSLALSAPALAQSKTLKFVSWQKDERGVGDWWGEVIKEFERTHQGVKIEWTKVERGAFADTIDDALRRRQAAGDRGSRLLRVPEIRR